VRVRLWVANKNYSSWSLRPWLALRAAGIPFEERMARFGDGPAWAELRRRSPSGKVPCLEDGAVVVWESLAIVEYAAERTPSIWPEDPAARAWARAASAEMHAGFADLRQRCSMSLGVRIRLHERPDALRRDVDRIAALFADGLGRFGGPWLAGARFTAVDAFFAPVAFRVRTYGLELPPEPAAYVERLLAHPDVRAWEAEALAEPWRDEPHDAEILASGELLADHRAPARPASTQGGADR
jgi:glutathione S-transferase